MVTLRAPVSTSALWLAPRLPKFREIHPDIELRSVSNIWTDVAGSDDVDVELRVGRGDWTDAASEKLSDETIVPICGVNADTTDTTIERILAGPLIYVLGQEADWGRYFAAHNLSVPTQVSEYYVDTMSAAIELAATGGGYAVVMSRLVETANSTSKRVAVAGKGVPIPDGYYLMRPTTKRSKRAEVQLFEDWLIEQFAD